jgi:hypothetical protein
MAPYLQSWRELEASNSMNLFIRLVILLSAATIAASAQTVHSVANMFKPQRHPLRRFIIFRYSSWWSAPEYFLLLREY